MTFWQHLSLIGNSVGDRKAIELWQMIEYKILNTEALPPSLEINLQPLGVQRWCRCRDVQSQPLSWAHGCLRSAHVLVLLSNNKIGPHNIDTVREKNTPAPILWNIRIVNLLYAHFLFSTSCLLDTGISLFSVFADMSTFQEGKISTLMIFMNCKIFQK